MISIEVLFDTHFIEMRVLGNLIHISEEIDLNLKANSEKKF